MSELLQTPINYKEFPVNGSPVRIEILEGRTRPELGFLGPKGSYSEQAANTILGDGISEMQDNLVINNRDVVRKVESGELDLGIVASENSTEGVVMETLRELVRSKNTKILGEVIIPIRHYLHGRYGEEVKKIFSHPQALGQCSEYLYQNYPNVELIATNSTSEAAEIVKDTHNSAAIASLVAGEKNDLDLLAEETIGDNPYNATRFFVIGRGETEPSGQDTTTVVFTVKDREGILRDCLNVIAMHGKNLNGLHAHTTGRIGEYLFVASIDGHIMDERLSRALDLLSEEYCTSLNILGSYKKADLPEGVKDPGVINGNGDKHE